MTQHFKLFIFSRNSLSKYYIMQCSLFKFKKWVGGKGLIINFNLSLI